MPRGVFAAWFKAEVLPEVERARLFLITPRSVDLATFPALLDRVLGAGDVASLLITLENAGAAELQRVAEALTPVAQGHDVAVLVDGDTQAMARAKADGVHVSSGIEGLAETIAAHQSRRIVGAGGLKSRDEAMRAGEAGADYVFFGLIDLPEGEEPHRKSLDFGTWWAALFEPPCVVLAGNRIETVAAAAATNAEFVAVRDAVWNHDGGPEAAIARAGELLDLDAGRRAREVR